MTPSSPAPGREDHPDEIARVTEELRRRHGALFDTVSALLFRHDPVGIAHGPRGQYDLEACLILRRLNDCGSEAAALAIVHEVFCECFTGTTLVGPMEKYAVIAREIWTQWMERK